MKQRLLWIIPFSVILGFLFGYEKRTQHHNRLHPPVWLRVLSLNGVIPDSVVQSYREKYHVRILQNTANDVAQMEFFLKDMEESYDLVIAYGYQLKAYENKLTQLPEKWVNRLPIAPDLARSPNAPAANQAIPLLWGLEGILVNERRSTTASELTSWSDLMRLPQLKKRIALSSNPYELAGHLQRRNLISADVINSLGSNQGQSQVRSLLDAVELQWNVQEERLVNEAVWAMQMSNGQAANIGKKHSHFKFVIPDEGSTLWTINIAVPKSSTKPQIAQSFIDYLFEPDVSKSIVKASKEATVHRDLENDPELDAMEKPSFLRHVPVRRIRFIEAVVAGQAERLERLIFNTDKS
jgi:spermidine/putrescine transport system substrate-binding protein